MNNSTRLDTTDIKKVEKHAVYSIGIIKYNNIHDSDIIKYNHATS